MTWKGWTPLPAAPGPGAASISGSASPAHCRAPPRVRLRHTVAQPRPRATGGLPVVLPLALPLTSPPRGPARFRLAFPPSGWLRCPSLPHATEVSGDGVGLAAVGPFAGDPTPGEGTDDELSTPPIRDARGVPGLV